MLLKIQYSIGGEIDIENGVLVCKECHLGIIHGSKKQ